MCLLAPYPACHAKLPMVAPSKHSFRCSFRCLSTTHHVRRAFMGNLGIHNRGSTFLFEGSCRNHGSAARSPMWCPMDRASCGLLFSRRWVLSFPPSFCSNFFIPLNCLWSRRGGGFCHHTSN